MAAPALTQLDDIAADMAAVKGSWVVYQDFLAERDALAHKDWLSMRDQVCAAAGHSDASCRPCSDVLAAGTGRCVWRWEQSGTPFVMLTFHCTNPAGLED